MYQLFHLAQLAFLSTKLTAHLQRILWFYDICSAHMQILLFISPNVTSKSILFLDRVTSLHLIITHVLGTIIQPSSTFVFQGYLSFFHCVLLYELVTLYLFGVSWCISITCFMAMTKL